MPNASNDFHSGNRPCRPFTTSATCGCPAMFVVGSPSISTRSAPACPECTEPGPPATGILGAIPGGDLQDLARVMPARTYSSSSLCKVKPGVASVPATIGTPPCTSDPRTRPSSRTTCCSDSRWRRRECSCRPRAEDAGYPAAYGRRRGASAWRHLAGPLAQELERGHASGR
jgi:hypothetical protein